MQQLMIQKNAYSYLVSKNAGAIFDGSRLNLQANNGLNHIWILNIVDEVIQNTFGGAFYISGNNAPITLIENTKFVNNFGDNGASLSFNKGGGLFCKNCVFNLDQEYGNPLRGFIES